MDVIRYHTQKGVVYGLLVNKTKKKLSVILNELPIKVTEVSISEEKFITVMDSPPVNRVRQTILKAGKAYHKAIREKALRKCQSEGGDEAKVKLGKMSKQTLQYLTA